MDTRQVTIDLGELERALKRERYNVLVAARPVAPARVAFNRALQAIIDTLRKSELASGEIDALQERFRFTE